QLSPLRLHDALPISAALPPPSRTTARTTNNTRSRPNGFGKENRRPASLRTQRRRFCLLFLQAGQAVFPRALAVVGSEQPVKIAGDRKSTRLNSSHVS